MNRIVTLLLVGSSLMLATALTACGDDEQQASSDTPAAETATPAATETPGDDDWPESGTKAKPAQTAEPAGGKAASAEAVEIKGFAFAPKDVTVEVGQKITWTNADAAPHTVTAKSGDTFDSGTLAKGATFEFEGAKAGTVQYFCAIHPSMTATITVQ